MNAVLELLLWVSMIGAVDVMYFHVYRFKLYERPESVWEEVTHLSRHVIFLGIVASILVLEPRQAVPVVGALFALDLLNTSVDVWLERGSRQGLGGLPSAEYLLHVLSSVGLGAAIATLWWRHDAMEPLTPLQLARGALTLVAGVALLLIEASLFARAMRARCAWCGLSGGA